MASKKKENADEAMTEKQESAEDEAGQEKNDAEDAANDDTEPKAAGAEQPVAAGAGPVLGIHERLEDAELASLTGGKPDLVHSLNRITILTGALKTALPEAVKHVEDAALKADLEALLGML